MCRIVGGAAGIAVGHPFDTIKVRLQADLHGDFVSPMQSLKKTVRAEGVAGLFKGLASPLAGNVPIQAALFGGFGFFMKLLNADQQYSSTAAQVGTRNLNHAHERRQQMSHWYFNPPAHTHTCMYTQNKTTTLAAVAPFRCRFSHWRRPGLTVTVCQ